MASDPSGIINNAYTQSNNTVTSAANYANRLAQLAEVEFNISTVPDMDLEALDEMKSAINNILSNVPSISNKFKDSTDYDKAEKPDDISVGKMDKINVPDFTDAVPAVNYPQPLNLKPLAEPVNTYSKTSYKMPDAPKTNMPKAPEIAELSFPGAPSYDFPTFSVLSPADDIGEPTNYFSYDEAAFDSALQSPVVAALLNDIAGGSVPDEALEYNLAIARIDNQIEKAVSDAKRTFTQSGFSMPTGAMLSAIQAARLSAANQKITAVADHSLKMSSLKIDNRKAALTNAIQYESILRQFFGLVWERALNAAKYLNDAGMALFNARLEKYKAKWQAYSIAVQVFTEKIKALSIRADIYRAELQAVQIKAEVGKTRVEVYNAQIAAIEAQIKIYQSSLDAVKTSIEIDFQQLKVYAAETEAFGHMVSAQNTQLEMYKATIAAENMKYEPYKLALSAYQARLDGKKISTQIGEANLKAKTEEAKFKIEQYTADIMNYKGQVDSQMTYLQRLVELYQGDVSAFNAKGLLTEKAYGTLYDVRKTNVGFNIDKAKFALQKSELELKQQINQYDLKLNANKAVADVYKTLAAGFTSAINAIAMVTQTTK
ncbi:hypothetical protein [Candidatus Magnetominusculus xianensis]|uniref:Outer membrane efflux protein n=1 Tax=Candidatus Magnetominusculus xianensis TaxID=1748249 RepID=A0ABR5SC54_9BACT|nr:hypothetical protein [Candidatus Magnetominusculus xianensis]KWT73770.1 hypothetical protein ASN18_3352 [Candidatus Magnetominusculus xianensis]MBF0404791.1 hypothetical protein [Nitrospirota bacterium]